MKRHQRILSDDEQLARYGYIVDALPATVLDRAHAAVMDQLTPEQRGLVLTEAQSVASDTEEAVASTESEALAKFLRGASAERPAPSAAAAATLAANVVGSAPVIAYFATGVGSVDIDQRPPWVQDLAGHDGAPIDSATAPPRRIDFGEWYA